MTDDNPTPSPYEHPLEMLRYRRDELIDGIDSIAAQTEAIEEAREKLDRQVARLAASKRDLKQVEAALDLLEAGL